MFAKNLLITTAFAALLFGMGAMDTQSVHAQVIAACQCGQPACTSCNPCDCGQADCHACQTVQADACGCGIRSCRGCLKRRERPCRKCPSCQAEVCISESSMEKEKRSCWKTEQKIICIPKVRLPWQKCDGPICGKTKTVTLLKKHSYECEVCKHKWKVLEPQIPEPGTTEPTPAAAPKVVPVIQGQGGAQGYHTVPPQAPVINSLPYESNQGTSQPPIIQGNSGR